MANFINELLNAPSNRVSLPNPNAAMMIGQRGISSGFDKLQEVGKQIRQGRIDSDVGTAISSIGDTSKMNPKQYQDALFGAIGQVDGVSAMDAIGFATTLAKPRFDERKYTDDRVDARNLNSYRSLMSGRGSYGMSVDDYGNTYVVNKHTGQIEPGGNNRDTTGMSNPKNIVLKSITSRDENGVERTTQVPFDKTTGQPVSSGGDTNAAIVNYLNTEYGITSKEQLAALPVEKYKAIEADVASAFSPAVAGNAVANPPMGVKVPKKLDNTMQLPTGQTVYVDAQGTPYKNKAGQYLVKTQGAETVKRQSAKKDISNTLVQLDNILDRVKTDPSSVASIGSNFGDWVGNNLNDILKVPTGTRLNRNQIDATGGVIAAGLRKGVESGVMTESDFIRYQKLVPSVNDSPQEATYKGKQLMNQLSLQYGIVPPGYKRQFNTQTGEYRIVKGQ